MSRESSVLTNEELEGLECRLVVQGSLNSEFSEDDDWSVIAIESNPTGKVTIRLKNANDGRLISIVLSLSDFKNPVFLRDSSKILGRVFDIGMTIMEFSGINDFDQFRDNQEIEVTVGGRYRLLN